MNQNTRKFAYKSTLPLISLWFVACTINGVTSPLTTRENSFAIPVQVAAAVLYSAQNQATFAKVNCGTQSRISNPNACKGFFQCPLLAQLYTPPSCSSTPFSPEPHHFLIIKSIAMHVQPTSKWYRLWCHACWSWLSSSNCWCILTLGTGYKPCLWALA